MASSDSPAIQLLRYQRRWIADKARFKIGDWSRQTGKTFSTTLEAVLDCVDSEAQGRRARWTILSVSKDRAQDAMDNGVKPHLQALRAGFEAFEVPFDGEELSFEARLAGGSRIRAVAANPVTARGMTENLILDEFAHHKDSRAIWKALYPVVSRRDLRLRVVSTPNGKGNKFYELMTDPSLAEVWSRHVVDIYQAVTDGLDRDIQELRLGMSDPDGWAQEFELQWLDEASAWLSYDLINAVEHSEAGGADYYGGGRCYVGIDIAARNDLYVLAVLEEVGDVLWCRELITKRRISFMEQEAILDDVMRRYRVVRVAIDQTGMGEMPVERARRRHGSLRVEGVLFTAARKLDIATALKERMQDRSLRIPQGDAALRSDLHAVKSETGVTGARRLVAGRDTDGHADRFWALGLACAAAADPVGEIEFRGTGPRSSVHADSGMELRPARLDRAGFGRVRGPVDLGGF